MDVKRPNNGKSTDFTVGCHVRTQQGSGVYTAEVTQLTVDTIHLQLITWPVDALDPILTWSMKLAVFRKTGWRVIPKEQRMDRPTLDSDLVSGRLHAKDQTPQHYTLIREVSAVSVVPNQPLPEGVTACGTQTPFVVPDGVVGYVEDQAGIAFVRNFDWIVKDEFGLHVVPASAFTKQFRTVSEGVPTAGFLEAGHAMMRDCHQCSLKHGFWEGADSPQKISEKLMLIVCEVAEAMEGHRKGNPPDSHVPIYSTIEVELADAIIRIFDLSYHLKYRLIEAILAKVKYNWNRPYKHGKQC